MTPRYLTKARPLGRAVLKITLAASMRCLTFELTGARRQDALARTERMYRVPQSGPRGPAVARPVERGVRQRCTLQAMEVASPTNCCSRCRTFAATRGVPPQPMCPAPMLPLDLTPAKLGRAGLTAQRIEFRAWPPTKWSGSMWHGGSQSLWVRDAFGRTLRRSLTERDLGSHGTGTLAVPTLDVLRLRRLVAVQPTPPGADSAGLPQACPCAA